LTLNETGSLVYMLQTLFSDYEPNQLGNSQTEAQRLNQLLFSGLIILTLGALTVKDKTIDTSCARVFVKQSELTQKQKLELSL